MPFLRQPPEKNPNDPCGVYALGMRAGLAAWVLVLGACTATGVQTQASPSNFSSVASSLASQTPEQARTAAIAAELERLVQTRLELGAMYLQAGRYDVALGEVGQALQVQPQSVDAYNLQGWIYLALRDFAAADASFAHALKLRPTDADTLYNLGWSQCQQKHFEAAQQHFDAAQNAPRTLSSANGISTARILLARGVCQREAGQTEQATQTLLRAYASEPANNAIAYELALTYWQLADWPRAQFYIRRIHDSGQPTAASLWLGIRIERKLANAQAVIALARQLGQRFSSSPEWLKYEQGAFDE